MQRKIIGILLVLIGVFFIVTFQGWGFWLIDRIGRIARWVPRTSVMSRTVPC